MPESSRPVTLLVGLRVGFGSGANNLKGHNHCLQDGKMVGTPVKIPEVPDETVVDIRCYKRRNAHSKWRRYRPDIFCIASLVGAYHGGSTVLTARL